MRMHRGVAFSLIIIISEEAPLLGKQGRIRARAHVCLDSRVDECVGGNILISPLSSRPPQKKVHPHIHPSIALWMLYISLMLLSHLNPNDAFDGMESERGT